MHNLQITANTLNLWPQQPQSFSPKVWYEGTGQELSLLTFWINMIVWTMTNYFWIMTCDHCDAYTCSISSELNNNFITLIAHAFMLLPISHLFTPHLFRMKPNSPLMKELLLSPESRTHHGMSIHARTAFSDAACHISIVLHRVIPLHLAWGGPGSSGQSAGTLTCTGV